MGDEFKVSDTRIEGKREPDYYIIRVTFYNQTYTAYSCFQFYYFYPHPPIHDTHAKRRLLVPDQQRQGFLTLGLVFFIIL